MFGKLVNGPKSQYGYPAQSYEEALQVYAKNMKDYIRAALKEGTVGMSRTNLKQVVSTRGIDIHPSAFNRLFDEAVNSVKVKGFEIY